MSSGSGAAQTNAAPENLDATGPPDKARIREFYDALSRRLAQSKLGDASVFLNYGYVSLGADDEARADVPRRPDPTAVRLVCELIGAADLRGRQVLDVGCGRGGTVALLAELYGADAIGVDLAPEAIAFCRRRHRRPDVRFEVGDAERLPVATASMDAVTNIESSHVYPNRHGFFAEVRRVLKAGGVFFYTDLLPVAHWADVRTTLEALGLHPLGDRNITANVRASCDAVAARHAKAFGRRDAQMDNVLAVPGSQVYEQMRSGAWEYRMLRARRP